MSKKDLLYPENENGIYKYEYPMINGMKQYVQIRGTDRTNPVLLFLHGGPGGSVAGLCRAIQAGWEDKFTVVNWDQRNACKTCFANKSNVQAIAQSGSMSDYMNDIDGVIAYLHTVCEFERIILVGFSWGSIIGAEYARLHPEKLICYIGIGQVVSYFEGIDYVCGKIAPLVAENPKDKAMLDRIMSMPRDNVMSKAMMNEIRNFSMLIIKYVSKNSRTFPLKELLHSPFLKFREKLAMFSSDYTLFSGTYTTMIEYDFRKNMKFDIPVLFVYGDEDCNSPSKLMADCFEQVSAPVRRMEIISKAGHSCFYDNPKQFMEVVDSFLRDVL